MEMATIVWPSPFSGANARRATVKRDMKILVLNSGSSSQKACLYQIGLKPPEFPPAPLWEGRIEWRNHSATISVKNHQGAAHKQELPVSSREEAVRHLLGTSWSGRTRAINFASEIDVVGHRVVHGGPHFGEPAILTQEVRAAIDKVSAIAPLHIRAEVEGMEIIEDLLGVVPQVAVFDTGFHRQIPLPAAVYPGPYEWFESGIRRYGFHGINHQYCAERAAQMLGADVRALKIVSCHLGNGCSVTAIHEGRSIDTTMGFTPLDGLMMGTRSGAVDPGILTYVMRRDRLDAQGVDELLNKKSGLLGVSGVSSDMRDILNSVQQGHQRAKLAFEIYVHRLQAAIGGMAAVLGGMDVLVFTAGVGENSAEVRSAACRGLEFLGVRLNEPANTRSCLDEDISSPESRVRVLVIRAGEDWAVAKECWKLAHRERSEYSVAN